MVDDAFDESTLFANFNDNEEPSEEIKLLRKHLGKTVEGEEEEEGEECLPEPEDNDESQEAPNSAQSEYIDKLEEQNTKLKAIIKRMLGPQAFSFENQEVNGDGGEIDLIKQLDDNIQSKPFAIIMFLNNDMSTVHRREIEDVMKTISEKDTRQEVLLAQKLQAQNSAVPLKSFSANYKGRHHKGNLPKSSSENEDPYIVCACQYYKSFYLDRMGDPYVESNPGTIDFVNKPTYDQVYLKALPIVEESLNVRVKQMRRCFNCDGDHNMNDCPEPKDQAKINKNRAEFSANKANNSPAYQQGGENDIEDRFKDYKAGEISETLAEALDISLTRQLPPYIYRMRRLGYPPAYFKPLEEALKMFGPDGECMEEPGAEEGEMSGVKLPDVIKYVGYNAPIPKGVRDEGDRFGAPPCNVAEAELYISMKRAANLGYIENQGGGEPLAKRLKYDDMEMASGSESEGEIVEEKDKKGKTSEGKKKNKKSKEIDIKTYRNWYGAALSGGGISYVMCRVPPLPLGDVSLQNLPKNPITELDREPWKTASISWYDPLYGDLAAPTGTYDAIRTLLKETQRRPRKSTN